MTVKYGIQSLLIVDGTLESGTHSIDEQCGACQVKPLLQFFRNHTPHGVALYQLNLEVLQMRQTHV